VYTINPLIATGRYVEAESIAREVTERLKSIFGEEDPLTLTAKARLGLALYHLRRFEESKAIQTDVVEIEKHISGCEHPETLTM
jgi:hypothetical protein